MTNSKISEPLEVCWRVIEGSTTRILTCAIFGVSPHIVELRVGYFGGVPLHSQTMRDIESARVLAQNWRDDLRAIQLRQTFNCLDCNKPIKDHPWWYDPLADGINSDAELAPLMEAVSQRRPDPPTPASAPFHKVCLERQMGRTINS